MDIVVEHLNALDRISISTQNSEYQFQVLNPAQCRGILRGGACGEEQYEAVLVRETTLQTGMSALFYITAKESYKRLTTSVIISLALY